MSSPGRVSEQRSYRAQTRPKYVGQLEAAAETAEAAEAAEVAAHWSVCHAGRDPEVS